MAVGADGTVWGVDPYGAVLRHRSASRWERVPGTLREISVGRAGLVWGVNPSGAIFRRGGSRWQRVAGWAKHVSVGSDGTVWAVNQGGAIFRWARSRWQRIGGNLSWIAVGGARHVWGVNRARQVFRWTGSRWELIDGRLSSVSVGADGTVWGLDARGAILRRVASGAPAAIARPAPRLARPRASLPALSAAGAKRPPLAAPRPSVPLVAGRPAMSAVGKPLALGGRPQLSGLLGKPAGIWALAGRSQPVLVSQTNPDISKLPEPRRCPGERLGTLVTRKKLQQDYLRAVREGRKPPGEKFGVELELPLDAHLGYCKLLPDLRAYVNATWRNISPLFARGRRPNNDETKAIAQGFFQYGCRQIGRFLPGYARRVQVRRGGVETTGNWKAPIPDAEMAAEIKTGRSGGVAVGTARPRRDELTEVCTVTHPQLEATLREDVDQLTFRALKGIPPVASAAAPTPLGFDARSDVRTLTKKVEDLIKRYQGLLKRARGTVLPRLDSLPGLGRGSASAVAAPATTAKVGSLATSTALATALKPSGFDQLRQILLHGDLENIDPRLAGVNLNAIVGRLVGFYRKGAAARNFSSAQKHGTRQPRWEETAPPQTRGEVQHQSTAIQPRTLREVLRRAVNQWTDAYEYEALRKHLATAQAPGLTEIYRAAEALELYRFWTNCDETRAICQAPKLPVEQRWCQFCAIKAVRTQCLTGRQGSAGRCRHSFKARAKSLQSGSEQTLQVVQASTGEATVGDTLRNWLVLHAMAIGTRGEFEQYRTRESAWDNAVAKRLFLTQFYPDRPPTQTVKGTSVENQLGDRGWRHLSALPLTEWQRCYLLSAWKPACDKYGTEYPYRPSLRPHGNQLGGNASWSAAPLFAEVLRAPAYREYRSRAARAWVSRCSRKERSCLSDNLAKAKRAAAQSTALLRKQVDAAKGERGNAKASDDAPDAASVTNTIVEGASPILGALLGMLLEYAGLTDVMKTLTRAAGLTPEQGADCEDPEYRHETLGLSAKYDNKGDCLMRVFAKNFVGALEGMIIMLGNKLVEWGVDALRFALQGVKSAAIAAAGSVPFAGGFLAMLVDVLWEVVLNYGAKALLKGFVVAKLPEWLQIRKLSSTPLKEILEKPGPIIRVVAGVIHQLIDAALKYGKENWVAAGAATVMNGIRIALEKLVNRKNPAAYFWIRALIHAKKEVLREIQPGQDLGAQLLGLGRALVSGIASVIERRLTTPLVQSRFRQAVEGVKKDIFTASGAQRFFERVVGDLQRGQLKSLGEFVGQKLVPLVVPALLSFSNLPEWARGAIGKLSVKLFDALRSAGGGNWRPLLGELTDLGEAAARHALDAVPFSDPGLKKLALAGVDAVAAIFRDPAGFWNRITTKPVPEVKKLFGPVRSYLVQRLVGALPAHLGPERKHLPSVVEGIFSFLERSAAGGAQATPGFAATMSWLVKTLGPYARERASLLTKGTPIEKLTTAVIGWALNSRGPLLGGQASLDDLVTVAGDVLGQLHQTVGSYLTSGAKGAGYLSGFVQRLLARLSPTSASPKTAADLLRWIAELLGVRGAAASVAAARKALADLSQRIQQDADAFAVVGPALDDIQRGLRAEVLDLLRDRSVPELLSTLWNGVAPLLDRLARRLIPDRRLATLVGEALQILVRHFGLRSKMGDRSGPILDVKWSAWRTALRMVSHHLLGKVRELIPSSAAPLGRLLERAWERLLSFALSRLNMGKRAWEIGHESGTSLLRHVVLDLLGALEEMAVKEAPTLAVRHLVGGLFSALKTVLEDPAGFWDSVKKDAAGTLLPILPTVLQGFLYAAVLEPLRTPCASGAPQVVGLSPARPGSARLALGIRAPVAGARPHATQIKGGCRQETAASLVVKALLDGALWILHEPHKRFAALVRDLNGRPAQLIKRIVGTLGKALVETIESPLPRELLLGAVDFVVNQWRPEVRR